MAPGDQTSALATTEAETDAGAATAEGGAALPAEVAYVPSTNPNAPALAAADVPAQVPAGDQPPAVMETAASTAAPPPAAAEAAPSQQPQGGPVLENGGPILTAGVMPEPPQVKKKSFLSSLFSTSQAAAAPAPKAPAAKQLNALAAEEPKPLIKIEAPEPTDDAEPVQVASLGANGALPGVRQTALFEIKRKSGIDDDSDVDLHEDEEPAIQMASAAGLARLAPNGLLKQRESVDVACLKPGLVRMLKTVEAHYGKKMIITSGYRSPTYNRKVRGAKKSQHMFCAAADVQVPGVSKWELAKFVRSMPQRGGVGTYCHTESVHIDIGPERDWNWRCRRRK